MGIVLHGRHYMGCWWYSGSTCVSHHCDLGSIPASCSYLVKVIFVACEKMLSSFTLPSIVGSLLVLRFPSVVTLDL